MGGFQRPRKRWLHCIKKNFEGWNWTLEEVNEQRLYENRDGWRSFIKRPTTNMICTVPGVWWESEKSFFWWTLGGNTGERSHQNSVVLCCGLVHCAGAHHECCSNALPGAPFWSLYVSTFSCPSRPSRRAWHWHGHRTVKSLTVWRLTSVSPVDLCVKVCLTSHFIRPRQGWI